jgi:hypothetical protein
MLSRLTIRSVSNVLDPHAELHNESPVAAPGFFVAPFVAPRFLYVSRRERLCTLMSKPSPAFSFLNSDAPPSTASAAVQGLWWQQGVHGIGHIALCKTMAAPRPRGSMLIFTASKAISPMQVIGIGRPRGKFRVTISKPNATALPQWVDRRKARAQE